MHIYTNNIDNETKNRALFVLSTKGSSLSKEVQKIIEENAKEFEKIAKGE